MPAAALRVFPRWPSLGLSATLWFGLTVATTAAEPQTPRKTYTALERMQPARLKAAQEDAQRLQQARRRDLGGLVGLNDYRVILHAHAEDSAHTGGTRAEMLADAKQAGVHAILLTDHFRPPKDFILDSWRGLHDGVLFLPGSENRGFLLYPTRSIMDHMEEPTPAFVEAVRADGGLIFLSHIEERRDHPMDGLTGLEIYNSHAESKKNAPAMLALMLKLTDPAGLKELEESLRLYPDALFSSQAGYPADYLAKWDSETKTRRLTGVAANDCHHNLVLLVKMVDAETVRVGTNVDADDRMRTVSAKLRPGIRELTKGHQPGDVLARVDLDPYHRSFRSVSTHVFASQLTERAIRLALREGHAYVSHDWMCDPTGFSVWLFWRQDKSMSLGSMGGEVKFAPGQRLSVQFPVACHGRLLKDGRVIAEHSGESWEHELTERGVYRVEGWLEVGGEERPWIYANPVYVR